MFRPILRGLVLAAALPFSTLSAQAFNFTTSGGFVSNLLNSPPVVITHNTVTGPLNPFGITRQVSLQFVMPTANPNVIDYNGTFTWFTANTANTILGSYFGSVFLGAAGSFTFTNDAFTITGGTGVFTQLRGGGRLSGGGQFFGNPTLPGDVPGTSSITYVGTATTVPEPSSKVLVAVGLGALALSIARRRATKKCCIAQDALANKATRDGI